MQKSMSPIDFWCRSKNLLVITHYLWRPTNNIHNMFYYIRLHSFVDLSDLFEIRILYTYAVNKSMYTNIMFHNMTFLLTIRNIAIRWTWEIFWSELKQKYTIVRKNVNKHCNYILKYSYSGQIPIYFFFFLTRIFL